MIDVMLKHLRTASGCTQQNIADYLGINRSTYSYYESGRIKPGIDVLAKLSRLYKIRLTEMLPPSYESDLQLRSDGPELPPIDDEHLKSFSSLTRSEQQLVLLFRGCKEPDKFLSLVRELTDEQE